MLVAAASNDLALVVFVVGSVYLCRRVLLFGARFLGSVFTIIGGFQVVVALAEGTDMSAALPILGGGLALKFVASLFRPQPATG